MVVELFSFTLFAVLLGFRHGIDSDHVAAIADMVGAESQRNKQLRMGILYALGHGSIVLTMGLIALFLGSRLPEGVLASMEFLVGLSLLVLGAFILYSIFSQRNNYKYESRVEIVSKWIHRALNKEGKLNLSVSKVGFIGAFVIGIVHGIGAETPTQVMLITSSVGLDNVIAATMQLVLFTIGVLFASIAITYAASWGFMKARFRKKIYFILGSVTGIYSVWLGITIINEI